MQIKILAPVFQLPLPARRFQIGESRRQRLPPRPVSAPLILAMDGTAAAMFALKG